MLRDCNKYVLISSRLADSVMESGVYVRSMFVINLYRALTGLWFEWMPNCSRFHRFLKESLFQVSKRMKLE